MWTKTQPLNVDVSARPARIAYLIPESPAEELLDELVSESLSRWGGRRSPFIPTDGRTILPAYMALLDLWDADIIYSYVQLSDDLEDRLYRLFAPSEIQTHKGLNENEDEWNSRPDYAGNYEFVSSLSLIPLFERRAKAENSHFPQVTDKDYWGDENRDIDDTFGFISNSFTGRSLLPHASRICFRPSQKHIQEVRPTIAHGISFVEDLDEFLTNIAKHPSILTLTKLADMICPHLNYLAKGRENWNDHLTIVVGDTADDRLLFWNAQQKYPALGVLEDLPVLRVSPKRLENGIPDWLAHWVHIRNHRHINGNHAPHTILRSCSLPKRQLDEIANSLNPKRHIMISSEHHPDPCLFGSCEKWTSKKNRRGRFQTPRPPTWIFPRVQRQARVRFRDSQFEVPLAPPWHIENFPSSILSRGVWAVELTIERAEDHSRYVLPHFWKFPRRLRIETAFEFDNYGPNDFLVLLPPCRPTADGNMTIWESSTWPRPILTVPTDFDAFTYAIVRMVPGSPEERRANDQNLSSSRFSGVALSDKGRDLLGVFQFFGSLPEALDFLTSSFWLKVIQSLSPEEPAHSKNNICKLAMQIREFLKIEGPKDAEFEQIAKRALFLASRSFVSESQQLKCANFETLFGWAPKSQNSTHRKKIKSELIKSITHLRNKGFLWQGFRWTCSFCQHNNWVPLDQLSAISFCEICRTPQASPVDRSLDFRLSPFVHHAFSSTSAQDSVIWCLKQLADRANQSFAFAPTLNMYCDGKTEPKTDLDIIATIDGKFYIVEVKSSFSGINQKSLDQLKYVGEILHPDFIIIAVNKENDCSKDILHIITEFRNHISNHDIDFELLTLDNSTKPDENYIPLPLNTNMKWSGR